MGLHRVQRVAGNLLRVRTKVGIAQVCSSGRIRFAEFGISPNFISKCRIHRVCFNRRESDVY